MKKIRFTILVLMGIFISLNFIAGATTYHYDYNFNAHSARYISITEQDLILSIETGNETNCYYVEGSGTPNNLFEVYGKNHQVTITNLEEGTNRYFVMCKYNNGANGPIWEFVFETYLKISGTVSIEGSGPMKSGTYSLDLVTSKIPQTTPILEYTFDNLVWKNIPLESSGTNWKGYLIIPKNSGEVVGSLRFEATDLEGEKGKIIKGETIFLVDTIKPSTIETIEAIGYVGQIRLNWHFEEEVYKYNIYRSKNPQIEYTDFYKTASGKKFTDNDVVKGDTYYYRVAAVDEAGNIGDLSKEIYATALFNNESQEIGGLDFQLIGKVDNFITGINLLLEDIEIIKDSAKTSNENELFEELKLNKEIDNQISELNSLKRDVEKYRFQDLSESELDSKINSASLKMNIIKKKIPEDLTILEEESFEREITEENLQRILLQFKPDLADSQQNRIIKETLKLIEEKNLKIFTKAYNLEVIYLDGTKKELTFVEESLESELERASELYIVMSLPEGFIGSNSDLKLFNLNYEFVQGEPVVSFGADTKKISYIIDERSDLNYVGEIIISPVKIVEDESKITGAAISGYVKNESFGIWILIIFICLLVGYFTFIKFFSKSKEVFMLLEDMKDLKKLISENKKEESNTLYNSIREKYKKLSKKEKKLVFEEIQKIGGGLKSKQE